jgi:hypothetical protein
VISNIPSSSVLQWFQFCLFLFYCLQDLHIKLLIKTNPHCILQLSSISIVSSVSCSLSNLPSVCLLTWQYFYYPKCASFAASQQGSAPPAWFWGLGINRTREAEGSLPTSAVWSLPYKAKQFKASILLACDYTWTLCNLI